MHGSHLPVLMVTAATPLEQSGHQALREARFLSLSPTLRFSELLASGELQHSQLAQQPVNMPVGGLSDHSGMPTSQVPYSSWRVTITWLSRAEQTVSHSVRTATLQAIGLCPPNHPEAVGEEHEQLVVMGKPCLGPVEVITGEQHVLAEPIE